MPSATQSLISMTPRLREGPPDGRHWVTLRSPSLGACSLILWPMERHDGPVATDDEQIAEVEAMFADKGFSLIVEERAASKIVPETATSFRHDYWVDLISLRTGQVALRNYGSGPTRSLAIVATEQRWLVEQEGLSSSPGHTYVEMAEERLRQGRRD